MSLDYNFTEIPKNSPTDAENDETKMHPVLYTLIWATISIGLDEITWENVDEWVARLRMYEGVFGTFLNAKVDGKFQPTSLTRKDVETYIGMYTNASTLTRRQFTKRVWDRMDRENK